MRLVIDLQGAQGASRLRGIGRLSYELAYAMAQSPRQHEVILALNGLFPGATNDLITSFKDIIGKDAIKVWYPAGETGAIIPDSTSKRVASERIRARFLQSLQPDLVHVSSHFEGFDDNIITGLPPDERDVPSVATLYDLIPLIRRDQYLDGAWIGSPVRETYLRQVEQLHAMPALLAISESSRQEAIEHLGMRPEQIFNIRAGVAETFRPAVLNGAMRREFHAKYNLPDSYVLFVGGGDLRKNEQGLITAFGMLPDTIRSLHKLVIVGRVDKAQLWARAEASGVSQADVVLISFVHEADLSALYSGCTLFVFPSLHEGFGLPVLEAMACGAAVIGSNTSSLPEVIGRSDATCNPHDPASIAQLMHRALADDGFRRSLMEHGLKHAGGFTWQESARRAWSALESIDITLRGSRQFPAATPASRLSLATTAPLPPQHSGIADYVQHLLPALAEYYDITLVAEDPEATDPSLRLAFEILTPEAFSKRALDFDRVVHQLGNSEFHCFQIEWLLPQYSGVVVLHDVFLANILRYIEITNGTPEQFSQTLLMTHGPIAVRANETHGADTSIQDYPCSLRQIQQCLGVIVHSQHARDLIERSFGPAVANTTQIVSTTRGLPTLPSRKEARARLGIDERAMIVATFGGVSETKLPWKILEGFAASSLARQDGAVLAFVGSPEAPFMMALPGRAHELGIHPSLVLTRRISAETYCDWLAAADIAVQLRKGSRGETSAGAADCLAAGIPAIVNAHGALGELPQAAVLMLADIVETDALAAAIDRLACDPDLRRSLGDAGRAYGGGGLSAINVARAYCETIEEFYAVKNPATAARDVIATMRGAGSYGAQAAASIGQAISWTFPVPQPRRIMLDITSWSQPMFRSKRIWLRVAKAVLQNTLECDRGQLLDWHNGEPMLGLRQASRILGVVELPDEGTRPPTPADILICPVLNVQPGEASKAVVAWARRGGASVVALALTRVDLTLVSYTIDCDVMVTMEDESYPSEECGLAIRLLLDRAMSDANISGGSEVLSRSLA